jgi:penicillin-binding protein 1C
MSLAVQTSFAVLLCLVTASALAEVPSFAAVKTGWRPSEAYLLDREGRVLHELRVDYSVRRLAWAAIGEISPAFLDAVIAAEDRRFYAHGGVDWRAVAGAVLGLLAGERARGASTITMQLAAMLDPALDPKSGGRSSAQKLAQMRAARALEDRWSKAQVLEAYVNLASYHGELQGIGAAAQELFGKRPSGLSAVESQLLAALLASPNRRGPKLGRRACAIAGVARDTPQCGELMRLALAIGDSPNPRPSRLSSRV